VEIVYIRFDLDLECNASHTNERFGAGRSRLTKGGSTWFSSGCTGMSAGFAVGDSRVTGYTGARLLAEVREDLFISFIAYITVYPHPYSHDLTSGPKLSSELVEHNGSHQQKRRLCCTLSIAIHQLIP
jgi:hypothetical protein